LVGRAGLGRRSCWRLALCQEVIHLGGVDTPPLGSIMAICIGCRVWSGLLAGAGCRSPEIENQTNKAH